MPCFPSSATRGCFGVQVIYLDCICPRGFFHSLMRFIPLPPQTCSLSLFLCIYIYILSVIIVSILLTDSSIRLFLWNKTWIHYSFIQMYLSSAVRAWLLSARLFSHCTSVIHPSYGPIWKHHDMGGQGGWSVFWQCEHWQEWFVRL